MGADWLGHPIAPMPQTHRKALDAVRWPTALLAPPEPQGSQLTEVLQLARPLLLEATT
jgi:hypothetical protein